MTLLILQQNDNAQTRSRAKVVWGAWGGMHLSFCNMVVPKRIDEGHSDWRGFAHLHGVWASFGGRYFWPLLHVNTYWSRRWSAVRHWNIEFCVTTILVITEWPWMPSYTQFVCVSDPLFFDSWLLTSSPLLALGDIVIKMCSLGMNTECLVTSEVFGGWPLL